MKVNDFKPSVDSRTPTLERHQPNLLFPDDDQFWFQTQRQFGAGEYGGSLFGEVLATASRITSGDYESWYIAWNDIADRLADDGAEQLAREHRVSARDSFLRAFNYYRASEFFLHADESDARIQRAYEHTVGNYQQAAALFDPPILPVEIPYEGTTLPGYWHRVDTSDTPRPTLIMHTGFDGCAEEMHLKGARAGVERGYNVLTFDGPGQFGPIHREGIVFRPDWENVVTPVLDFVLQQPGVVPDQVALWGASLGGYLAPRAAAFEHRLAACIAFDGVFDLSANLSAEMREIVEDDTKTDELETIAQQISASNPSMRWALIHGRYAYGAKNAQEYLRLNLGYTLAGGIAEQITCPTLVCESEDDATFKGQPKMLFDHLTCPKEFLWFARATGAGQHCSQGAGRYAYARIFDWLDDTIGGRAASD